MTMNLKRMQRWVKIMKNVARSRNKMKFDLDIFCENTTIRGTAQCGTVACTAGWAALDPGFRKAGLRINRHGTITFRRKGNVFYYARALQEFFGLSPLDIRRISMNYGGDYGNRLTANQAVRVLKRIIHENLKG